MENRILLEQTLFWSGEEQEKDTGLIPIPQSLDILLRIENKTAEDLTVVFYHKVGDDYLKYRGADGEALSFEVSAGDGSIYGPIQGFPRYDGGKVRFVANAAPGANEEVIVQVLGV